MRHGQKTGLKTIPNRRKAGAFNVPILYGCALPPKATLAHKHIRILKRLAKGGSAIYKLDGKWQWVSGSSIRVYKFGGYIKDALLRAMQALGLAQCIGLRWLITADGRKAIGVA